MSFFHPPLSPLLKLKLLKVLATLLLFLQCSLFTALKGPTSDSEAVDGDMPNTYSSDEALGTVTGS